jgi:hypothetical protein
MKNFFSFYNNGTKLKRIQNFGLLRDKILHVAQNNDTANNDDIEIVDKNNTTLEVALEILSYSMLQEYAGINNKSKTKDQLIKIIIENFNQIKKKMEERKLKILNKQLSY